MVLVVPRKGVTERLLLTSPVEVRCQMETIYI